MNIKNFILFLFCICLCLQELYANSGEKELSNHQNHAFTLLLNASQSPDFEGRASLKNDYSNFIIQLKEKQEKWNSDHRLLKHVFYKTHKEFLKNYIPYESFSDLFTDGTYGCLTGTALYAFVLDELGYEYEIIETNYHMFLLVNTQDHQYLFESTDPVNGFEYKTASIKSRINAALAQNEEGGKNHNFAFDIYRSVNFVQLIGLQYYNLAIKFYNEGDLAMSLYSLNEASKFDRSERIDEFLKVILESVNNPDLLRKSIDQFDELSLMLANNEY